MVLRIKTRSPKTQTVPAQSHFWFEIFSFPSFTLTLARELLLANLAKSFQAHFHTTSAKAVAHRCQRKHCLKYRLSGYSSLPFAAEFRQVLLEPPGMASLQAGLPGVEALLLQSEDSARSSLPSYLTKAASQEALGAKCFLWLFFKSLEWTQPILSYYFRRKSAVNPDHVLEKSVQHFKVLVLSSYLKFGSQVASVNKQPLPVLLLLFTALNYPVVQGEGIGWHLSSETYSLDLVIAKQELLSASHLPPSITVTVSS